MTIDENVRKLLLAAFSGTACSKVCRDTLLAAFDPTVYEISVGELWHLDQEMRKAALDVLSYRLLDSKSIESLIVPNQVLKLKNDWINDNPWYSKTKKREHATESDQFITKQVSTQRFKKPASTERLHISCHYDAKICLTDSFKEATDRYWHVCDAVERAVDPSKLGLQGDEVNYLNSAYIQARMIEKSIQNEEFNCWVQAREQSF
ncbi:hypothetical protein SAMN04488523_1092 [Sulfitobacter brevis]|uniref:DUF7673 domain-containing protein n=1 Tax=Sulfitobacter brevis TaxID=74348 RepID=A0A1I2C6T3_9RHOB|nr:hypothetical protein [Sulfitobacter brevis]SFE63852.1 hypothetical protein SAMN04488523_1092 [Sulfitobacter brevis]